MSSHRTVLGIFLILISAGVLVFLLGQPVIRKNVEVPFRAALSGLGIDTTETITTSTHVGKVIIDFVSLSSGVERAEEYVRIRMTGGPQEYLNVTGWTIVSDVGVVRIPMARDFNTVAGSVGNISLRGGSMLTLYAGKSPNGENVRISENEWAVWVDKPFLSFPHGSLYIIDDKGERVSAYSY